MNHLPQEFDIWVIYTFLMGPSEHCSKNHIVYCMLELTLWIREVSYVRNVLSHALTTFPNQWKGSYLWHALHYTCLDISSMGVLSWFTVWCDAIWAWRVHSVWHFNFRLGAQKGFLIKKKQDFWSLYMQSLWVLARISKMHVQNGNTKIFCPFRFSY